MQWTTYDPTQKKIILAALILVAVSCLFPPWYSRLDWEGHKGEDREGYAPLFAPPDASTPWTIEIDLQRLALQVFGIFTVMVVAVLWTGERKGSGPSHSDRSQGQNQNDVQPPPRR